MIKSLYPKHVFIIYTTHVSCLAVLVYSRITSILGQMSFRCSRDLTFPVIYVDLVKL